MKRIAWFVGIGVLLIASAVGAETVVSTHAVFGEIAEIVGGGEIEVVTIIPSGFCPAQYDLAPSDFVAVLDATLILYSGFESWMETLAAGSSADLVHLSGSWSTPDAAVEKTEAIRDSLSGRFPELASTFAANADAYIDRLLDLKASLVSRAEELNVSSISVLCMAWQADFVSWLGFDVAATYGPPAGLTLRDLVRLADAGSSSGAELVIDNLQSGVEFGGKLAREIAAIHVVLSNFPGAMPDTATVLDLLARNAEALFAAIEPWEEVSP